MDGLVNFRNGGVLSSWPWVTTVPPVTVEAGKLFWACDDPNIVPRQACDWLSVKKIQVSWTGPSFSGSEVLTAGLYRVRQYAEAAVETGDAVESWLGMVKSRGIADWPDNRGLWAGRFREDEYTTTEPAHELYPDEEWEVEVEVGINLGLPVPAVRGGEVGWTMATPPSAMGPGHHGTGVSAGASIHDYRLSALGYPVAYSSGYEILGDDGGIVGEQEDDIEITLEVTERW